MHILHITWGRLGTDSQWGHDSHCLNDPPNDSPLRAQAPGPAKQWAVSLLQTSSIVTCCNQHYSYLSLLNPSITIMINHCCSFRTIVILVTIITNHCCTTSQKWDCCNIMINEHRCWSTIVSTIINMILMHITYSSLSDHCSSSNRYHTIANTIV